jgi:glucosyl-dolichyl phosphate glucuronosyltransferase
MKITIILCTYNRCQRLGKALESVAAQRLPESDEFEVLVVDNSSRDRTREVVESFCRRFPGRFRYLFEPHQGKSYALNAGIRSAQGDILAFTDDDVTVEATWLQNLTVSLHDSHWAGTGGRILPQQPFTAPPWLSLNDRYALGPCVFFDLGLEVCELAEPPFGANMAFRKDLFEKYGGFRTDLGPRPDSEIRSEDSEFACRLLSEGERLRYEPSAVVYHAVPESRLQKAYFLAWWYDKGRADIRAYGIPHAANWRLCGVPLSLLRRLTRWTLQWLIAIGAAHRFTCKRNVWHLAGTIMGCYQWTRRQNAQTPDRDADVRHERKPTQAHTRT